MLTWILPVVSWLFGVVAGWFVHKIYLRSFVYRPSALNILRYTRRRPNRARTLKIMRKLGRKQSLVKKANHSLSLDRVLAGECDF